MTTIMQVKDLTKSFGGLTAVNNVSFDVETGLIKALIGPNGAGKTTLLNMVSGLHEPTSGEIRLSGAPVHGKGPHQIASYGVARTFQNVQLFNNMSVLENVMVGRHLRSRKGLLSAMVPLRKTRAEEREIMEQAKYWLHTVGLSEYADNGAGDLPFGRQRLLEIARALATEPKLLLLDEAASGLSTREKKELVDLIFKIRGMGITIFLVDHDMDLVMGISDEVVVLDHGEKIAEGTPKQVQNDERVIAAYLGEEPVDA